MGAKTGIQWCDSTWNPVLGCTPISEGCKHCWASALVTRFPSLNGGKPFSEVRFYPERLSQPAKWKKPRRIFVGGMTDLFHEQIPNDWRDQIFIAMLKYDHTYLILTKRAANMRGYIYRLLSPALTEQRLGNIWLGVTVDSDAALGRLTHLGGTPAIVRWISVEPMLSPLRVISQRLRENNINWVVIGCESGPGRRPMKLEWAEALVEECREAGIACFVKQIEIDGRVVHDIERFPKSLQVREWPR